MAVFLASHNRGTIGTLIYRCLVNQVKITKATLDTRAICQEALFKHNVIAHVITESSQVHKRQHGVAVPDSSTRTPLMCLSSQPSVPSVYNL